MNLHSRLTDYVGRFAPSPTGALHAGSLVAAMASYLDARAHGGRWLLRIEDLDPPRELAGATQGIITTLASLGFEWDGPILRQSERTNVYHEALARLSAAGLTYPCCCSRREFSDNNGMYPGTCRLGMRQGANPRAWRIRVNDIAINWHDRALGAFSERLDQRVGDFVLKRADGLWAYQLAVVVDDALSAVNAVVRGDDLLDSTARQIFLQRQLQLPTPSYLHIPVVRHESGEKLSKQTRAKSVNPADALAELANAARHLQLGKLGAKTLAGFWNAATARWRERLNY